MFRIMVGWIIGFIGFFILASKLGFAVAIAVNMLAIGLILAYVEPA